MMSSLITWTSRHLGALMQPNFKICLATWGLLKILPKERITRAGVSLVVGGQCTRVEGR